MCISVRNHCVLAGASVLSFLPRAKMGDDDEIHLHVTYASHSDMDAAFCARMREAIAAGLESAPVGIVTTPGAKNLKYVPAELQPFAYSLSDRDFV